MSKAQYLIPPVSSPDASIVLSLLAMYLLLVVASWTVGQDRWVRPQSMLRKQVNVWWRILPWVSLALLTYPLGPVLLLLLIGGLAWRELALHYPGATRGFQCFCAVALGLQVLLVLWQAEYSWALAAMPLLAITQLGVFWWRRTSEQLLRFLFLLVCSGVACMAYLRSLPQASTTGAAWFFLLCAVTALNDVGQFIVGTTLGKQKIAQRISPNKTWQGFFGGIVVSMLISLAAGSYLHLASPAFLLLLGFSMSVVGFWGDLLFSAAKRFLGIKDFSNLLPGHGGILDRADSLVLTAPLLYCFLRWA